MFFSLNAYESMGLTDRIALVCIPVVLLLIAMLLPRKHKVLSIVARAVVVLMLLCGAAIRLIPKLGNLTGLSVLTRIYESGGTFIPVVLLAFAFALLWGIFFPDAYLTQGLYGLVCTVPLTAGLLGFIFPTWLATTSFTDIFTASVPLFGLLEYCALVFVPLYLIVSGKYRMHISSVWHALFGMTFFGSLLLTLTQAGVIDSPAYASITGVVLDLKTLTFGEKGLTECGIFVGAAVVLALMLGLISSVCRRVFCHTGEKFAASETRGAMLTRFIGRIFSGVGSLVLVFVTPGLISLIGLTGTGATLFCLVPIAFMLLVQLFIEFAAEDTEIRHAQTAAANA